MPDGKLHIKGTHIIKGSKEDKEDKVKKSKSKKGKKEITIKGLKQRKPRKQKIIPSGTAYTGQSFGQQATAPYTAQALMTAMALRSPPPQVTYMEQPQQKPALDQSYKFQELLDNPNIPLDVPVVTTKKELLLKAEPFLKKEIQQNVQQYRRSLEDETIAYEERAKEAEQHLYQQTLAMRQELEHRQQFFENELEQATDYYDAELSRMAMAAESQKKEMQLENIRDKAKFMSESVLDKTMFNLESQKQKKQLEQQKQEMGQLKKKIEVEKIGVTLQKFSDLCWVARFKYRTRKEGKEKERDEIDGKGERRQTKAERTFYQPFHTVTLTHAHRHCLSDESSALPLCAGGT